MIPTLLSITALTIFLIWAIRHVGVPTSISSLFYPTKTRWTYTMVISGIGALMTGVDPHSYIHVAGVFLVLATAAPHFKHENSLSKQLHYSFTAMTAILAIAYLSSLWIGIGAAALLGVAKLLEKRIKNAVFWVEVLLFFSVLIGIIIKLK